MEMFGIRFVGVNEENGHKLLLTIGFVFGILLLRAAAVGVAHLLTGRHRNDRFMFWMRQGVSSAAALLMTMAVLSIWFDDPERLTTGLGIFGAGLAFALQRVVTALAGYLVIMRGNTFTVGDRITMGGVRGDVIALTFMQTKIMEMGQPPSVQGADPTIWVRSCARAPATRRSSRAFAPRSEENATATSSVFAARVDPGPAGQDGVGRCSRRLARLTPGTV